MKESSLEILLTKHVLKHASWLCTQSRFSFKLLAVITLEMNYPSEMGYPLDNSHQTDNTTLII